MSFFSDLINALPTNAALKAENEKLKSEKDILETEVACLKDDLRKSEAEKPDLKLEIEALKLELEKYTKAELDDDDLKILKLLWNKNAPLYIGDIEEILHLGASEVSHHLDKLKDKDFVKISKRSITEPKMCELTIKGRAFVGKKFPFKLPKSSI
jgi:DNA-binding MarR family transcriptional regulator